MFSILIPTRNRPLLLQTAIQSVLRQSYHDYEILISDNSDQELGSKELIDQMMDNRIRYYRTAGDLSMPDNWEFVLSKAKGKYVTVLEDKQALYPDALAIIQEVLKSSNFSKAVAWHNDILDDTYSNPVFIHYQGSGDIKFNNTDDLLKIFTDKLENWSYMPRMINSVLSLDYINNLKYRYGLPRFFSHACPDICAAIMQLSDLEQIVYIDSALCVTGGVRYSNGRAQLATPGSKCVNDFLNKIPSKTYIDDYVDIKNTPLPNNIVINDFKRLKASIGNKLSNYDFSIMGYLKICIRDSLKSKIMGNNNYKEIRFILAFAYSKLNIVSFIKILIWATKKYIMMWITFNMLKYKHISNLFFKLRNSNKRVYFNNWSMEDIVNNKEHYPILSGWCSSKK